MLHIKKSGRLLEEFRQIIFFGKRFFTLTENQLMTFP